MMNSATTMFRSLLLAALMPVVMLVASSSAQLPGTRVFGPSRCQPIASLGACTCPEDPPPLSDCEVDQDKAALWVAILSVDKFCEGTSFEVAVATFVILEVFKDNTGLGLADGDVYTVSSSVQDCICGVGQDLEGLTINPLDIQQWILFVTPTSGGSGALPGALCGEATADFVTDECHGSIVDPTCPEISALQTNCPCPTCSLPLVSPFKLRGRAVAKAESVAAATSLPGFNVDSIKQACRI